MKEIPQKEIIFYLRSQWQSKKNWICIKTLWFVFCTLLFAVNLFSSNKTLLHSSKIIYVYSFMTFHQKRFIFLFYMIFCGRKFYSFLLTNVFSEATQEITNLLLYSFHSTGLNKCQLLPNKIKSDRKPLRRKENYIYHRKALL